MKKKTTITIGIGKTSFLFIDTSTSTLLYEKPLVQLRRWAVAPEFFTMDFDDHNMDYIILKTTEAEAMSAVVSGYIDLMIRKQQSAEAQDRRTQN